MQPIDFKKLVTELNIDYTPAELHGFLSGLISGGIQNESWKILTYQFTNDGHAFSQAPLTKLTSFYKKLSNGLNEANTLFAFWLPSDEDNAFVIADSISEWTSHFLLGLGLAQPTLQQETGDIGEAINDLAEIAKLGYDEQDKNDDLLEACEEIIEYLRVVTLFLYSHFFKSNYNTNNQKLH